MIVFVEPHYDDFILSAGIYSFTRQIDKVVTVFTTEVNTGGTRALCKDLGKDYQELNFPDLDWKKPSILFESKSLYDALDSVLSDADLVLTTLGVGHNAHKFLKDFLIERFGHLAILFFRDFPHSYDSSKLKDLPFESYIRDFELVSSVGSDEDFQKKVNIFKQYYPTQKGLIWFEREQFLKPVKEEIYSYKSASPSLW